jgi:5-deoxy-D-glucuronate isomerase
LFDYYYEKWKSQGNRKLTGKRHQEYNLIQDLIRFSKNKECGFMESTLKKYAARIERNEVDPHIRYNGKKSGLILDPLREEVPLGILGFGIYQLNPHFITRETKKKEIVLIPQEGEFEAEINGKRFSGERMGGPFAAGLGKSNASALYVSCNSRFRIRGKGEVVFFEAPAVKEKPPFYLSNHEVNSVSRGDWVWRRDVTPLISPKDSSSNLVVGETYNPPGFWSGTPLHLHDKDQPRLGESGHEEVYYHRFHWKKGAEDRIGPYGVQLLMDGKKMMKAFLIRDKSIFAIPGGCHPVVTSPVSELIYSWGLAGNGKELMMRDLPEFAYLKSFEECLKSLERKRVKKILSQERMEALFAPHSFTKGQRVLLAAILKEKGYEID